MKTQLIIAYELGLVEGKLKEQLILNIEEVTGMIAGLIKYLKNTEIKGSKYSSEKSQTIKH